MVNECWWCLRVFHYPRKARLCGGCYQERYIVGPKINGKASIKRRNA